MDWNQFWQIYIDPIPEGTFSRITTFFDCLTLITLFVAQTTEFNMLYIVSSIIWRLRSLFACATVALALISLLMLLESYETHILEYNERYDGEVLNLLFPEASLKWWFVFNKVLEFWVFFLVGLLFFSIFRIEKILFFQNVLSATVPTSAVFYWGRKSLTAYAKAYHNLLATQELDAVAVQMEFTHCSTRCFISVIWFLETLLSLCIPAYISQWTHMFVSSVYLSVALVNMVSWRCEIEVGNSEIAKLYRKLRNKGLPSVCLELERELGLERDIEE